MKLYYSVVLLTALVIGLIQATWEDNVKPNIVIILADDMVSTDSIYWLKKQYLFYGYTRKVLVSLELQKYSEDHFQKHSLMFVNSGIGES